MIEIVWIVLFILWVAMGLYGYRPGAPNWAWVGPMVVLALLIGILGWVVFGGFHAEVVAR